ncbi:hypothetical protein KKH43_02165 [Patescibacteria group bacterium]|nr:hypothetical protein [Patescibacteria group bacterium]
MNRTPEQTFLPETERVIIRKSETLLDRYNEQVASVSLDNDHLARFLDTHYNITDDKSIHALRNRLEHHFQRNTISKQDEYTLDLLRLQETRENVSRWEQDGNQLLDPIPERSFANPRRYHEALKKNTDKIYALLDTTGMRKEDDFEPSNLTQYERNTSARYTLRSALDELAYSAVRQEKAIALEQVVGARYDELLEQRESLEEELNNYEPYNLALATKALDQNRLKTYVTHWKKEVRSKTHFLDNLDSLNIHIFDDNLFEEQGTKHPEIEFDSDDLRLVYENSTGLSYPPLEYISIEEPQPKLSQQIAIFLETGAVDQATVTLIHELIHIEHGEISDELTEAHAYKDEVFYHPYDTSIVRILKVLINDPSYFQDKEEAMSALIAVNDLYSMNVDASAIARHLRQATSGSSDISKQIRNVRIQANAALEKFNIERSLFEDANLEEEQERDEIIQAFNDLLTIEASNERTKARILLLRLLSKEMDTDEVSEKCIEAVQTELQEPQVTMSDDALLSDPESKVRVLFPANKEYLYEPNGSQIGIILGLKAKQHEHLRVGIFMQNVELDNGTVQWMNDPEEINSLAQEIAKYETSITFEEKKNALYEFAKFCPPESSSPELLEVIRALTHNEEERLNLLDSIVKPIVQINLIKRINTTRKYSIGNANDSSFSAFEFTNALEAFSLYRNALFLFSLEKSERISKEQKEAIEEIYTYIQEQKKEIIELTYPKEERDSWYEVLHNYRENSLQERPIEQTTFSFEQVMQASMDITQLDYTLRRLAIDSNEVLNEDENSRFLSALETAKSVKEYIYY